MGDVERKISRRDFLIGAAGVAAGAVAVEATEVATGGAISKAIESILSPFELETIRRELIFNDDFSKGLEGWEVEVYPEKSKSIFDDPPAAVFSWQGKEETLRLKQEGKERFGSFLLTSVSVVQDFSPTKARAVTAEVWVEKQEERGDLLHVGGYPFVLKLATTEFEHPELRGYVEADEELPLSYRESGDRVDTIRLEQGEWNLVRWEIPSKAKLREIRLTAQSRGGVETYVNYVRLER